MRKIGIHFLSQWTVKLLHTESHWIPVCDLEGQSQSFPKTIVVCISDPNLAILAWMGDELWHRQARGWHTDSHTHTQMQPTRILKVKSGLQLITLFVTLEMQRTTLSSYVILVNNLYIFCKNFLFIPSKLLHVIFISLGIWSINSSIMYWVKAHVHTRLQEYSPVVHWACQVGVPSHAVLEVRTYGECGCAYEPR